MNKTAEYIKQRLSLRDPLKVSLDRLSHVTDSLKLTKPPEDDTEREAFLAEELAKVKSLYPTCTGFQREFPSLAFSIATGVGKTRLMGACIAYLHIEKGVNNFFILAPNLTIYEKLVEDFGNPAYEKYIFQGISEFVHNPPLIITGENYREQGNRLFQESGIKINIFNISKFNRDAKPSSAGKEKGLPPKIKRLTEFMGESYWDYLTGLEDLVVLMDEAHRYHADASKSAINELAPILGIEMTATPFDEKGDTFQNVIYEYSLAMALQEKKYVKSPAIAKRKNFEKGKRSDQEIEIIKLEDAVSIHEETKKELEIYSANSGKRLVKPFILVVCKDINHAKEVYDRIESNAFYEGAYKGKVLQIDSSTKKQEEIEAQFISLESYENEIEIVIHVNMLKEGWDVTNLYTIVPLRAANAAILVEQTIGRGLRLPYGGVPTGVEKVDKLTIVAHENFDAILKQAEDPNSILNKLQFVEISEEQLAEKRDIIVSPSKNDLVLQKEKEKIQTITDPKKKESAQIILDGKSAIIDTFNDLKNLPEVTKVEDLNSTKVKKIVLDKVREKLTNSDRSLFMEEIVKQAEKNYDQIVTDFKKNTIEIPRIDLIQGEAVGKFATFNLQTDRFHLKELDKEILRMGLKDHVVDTIDARSSGAYGDPIKLIISELINFPEVDYDEISQLLYELSEKAYQAILKNLDKREDITNVIFQYKSFIAEIIYDQMKNNYKVHIVQTGEPKVFPFDRILPWNFTALRGDEIKSYNDSITPISTIPRYIFTGFEKACHFQYKFDSKAEQELSIILESDKNVEKWLRPAPNQFHIYWNYNSKRYEPDFVVETKEAIYIVEVKAENEISNPDVIEKMESAKRYCKLASEYTSQHGGKPWGYLLVPHTSISRSISFNFLIGKYKR